MRVFIEVPGLLELEQAEKWDEAKDSLMNLWHNDPQNTGKLCRALAECWYVLVEWEHSLNTDNLSYDSFQVALIETTQYGLEYCADDANFLWMAGFMIELFPFLSYTGDDSHYYSWKQMGVDMIRQAAMMAPDNLIAKILSLSDGTPKTRKRRFAAEKAITPLLDNLFPGNTAIEEYFKCFLTYKPY